jgi:hypothetical protein
MPAPAVPPLPPSEDRGSFGLIKYNDRNDLIAQFERDRLLRDAGYKVIHFTWRELFETPEVVIARIRQALAGRGAW